MKNFGYCAMIVGNLLLLSGCLSSQVAAPAAAAAASADSTTSDTSTPGGTLTSDSFNREDTASGLGTSDAANGGTAMPWVTAAATSHPNNNAGVF